MSGELITGILVLVVCCVLASLLAACKKPIIPSPPGPEPEPEP